MAELDSVAKILRAFYRLTGSGTSDTALTELGEAADEVAYTYLTRGCRNAQRWMLKQGYQGWRKRSTALSWSGADATDGGRYATLPTDFLRAYGNRGTTQKKISCLVEAGGDDWGEEVEALDAKWKGDYFYFLGDELWLCRTASPPATLYLDYHHVHPLWTAAVTIDFPTDARSLIVAEAANVAKEESWLPGGPEMEQKIERALMRARDEARDIARPSKQARQLRRPFRAGNHW